MAFSPRDTDLCKTSSSRAIRSTLPAPSPHTIKAPQLVEIPFGPAASAQTSTPLAYAEPSIYYRGIGFCSLSEAAYGVLMEECISDFRMVFRETVQVPVGAGRTVDFRVRDTFIEYHSIRIHPGKGRRGDYESVEQYLDFRREFKRLTKNSYRQEQLIEEAKALLAQNYYNRRREALDESPEFQNTELIVTTSLEEFYDRVIARFCTGPRPAFQEFNARFSQWVPKIASEARR